MPEFALGKTERQSVARASQLIRDAGWPEKATRIDDFLKDGKIVTTTEGSILTEGHANKDKIVIHTTGLDAPALTAPGDTDTPLARKDPELLKLAAVLLHEADHTLGHGDIEAYGEMIAFGRYVTGHINELFGGLTDEQKEAQRAKAREVEEWGKNGRNRYINQEPPDPPQVPKPPQKPGKIKIEDAHITIPEFGRFRLIPIESANASSPAPTVHDENAIGRAPASGARRKP